MAYLRPDNAKTILADLGQLLAERGERFELVVIGGTALLLLDLVPRPTKDFDVLAVRINGRLESAEPLPEALMTAAADIRRLHNLPDDWLNAGPTRQLQDGLPDGFESRLVKFDFVGLVVFVPSRADQVCLKMHAAADPYSLPNRHFDDLKRLDPNPDEVMQAAEWATGRRALRVCRRQVARVVEELTHDGG